ncbi:hypothetical protein IWC96_14425 [Brevundimonas sp. BAL450]|uniref:Bbp16 family capsid cement protein n=1 Tax=Brevundimonas sp. BAL450 TaxID=1708162 RepID=UPI0018CA30AA|nr:hypothetical protein [Brevundimonas sp. BAL450]MBG7616470.1 hypothetical protein [Brevundimonas sp. BAL450]
MIRSQELILSDDQAITASAASTNVIDLGLPGTVPGQSGAMPVDFGKGRKIPLHIQVTADFATLTSLTVAVQVDTVENFASPDTVVQTGAIPVASLKAGYVFAIDSVPLKSNQRYIRIYYTVAGTNASAGTVDAAITMGNQQAPL